MTNHLCPFMRKRPTAYRIRNGQCTDGIYAQPTLHRTNTHMHLGQSTTFCYKESTQQHFKQNERTAQLELAAYLYLGFQHHRQPYYLLRISQ